MKITVTGSDAVIKNLQELSGRAGTMPDKIGAFAIFAIKQRTQKGKDVDGGGFVPYTNMTEKLRKEAGKQINHVDLTFSGGMFAALKHSTSGNKTTIFFGSSAENAKAYDHQYGNPSERLPQRKFFGLDKATMGGVYLFLKDWIVNGKR